MMAGEVCVLDVSHGDKVGKVREICLTDTKKEDIPQVEIHDDEYCMSHKKRGKMIIINQKRFHRDLRKEGIVDREGSDMDCRALKGIFRKLGFDVHVHANVHAQSLLDIMSKAAAEDHGDRDCFACAILSHGEEGIVYGHDKKVPIADIVRPFVGDNCPSLVNKPKLFFIQACRGMKFDHGTEVGVDMTDGPELQLGDVISLPVEADFLFAYSTVSGYFSWRNAGRGSWFIQSLVKNLEQYEKKRVDLVRLLTRVNKDVALDFESINDEVEIFNRAKQVPCITSMLTKKVYL
ncbi:hypothetical protein CHS0354_041256 [Potamilus streckersoni]|uniref:Uncharacterized protein n=1 Tax=Potamilus streckersoni TaxID=2493646 RepID=A0AAE0SEX4_9BIVA|nr:hypothetical protein CHS0354_041256 [Potamilus streckersoni]